MTPGVGVGGGEVSPGVGVGGGEVSSGVGVASPGVGVAFPGVGVASPGVGVASSGVGVASLGVGVASPGVGIGVSLESHGISSPFLAVHLGVGDAVGVVVGSVGRLPVEHGLGVDPIARLPLRERLGFAGLVPLGPLVRNDTAGGRDARHGGLGPGRSARENSHNQRRHNADTVPVHKKYGSISFSRFLRRGVFDAISKTT